MFNTSHYYEQSQLFSITQESQLVVLQCTDAITFIRESSKVATIGSLVISAAAASFKFNPAIPLVFAGVFCASTLLASGIARCLEPKAQQIISLYRTEFFHIAKSLGIIKDKNASSE